MNWAALTTGKGCPSQQWTMLRSLLEFHGYADIWTPSSTIECQHDHQLAGTGAVFYQSTGLLQCVDCKGWQLIRKPIS